MLKFVVSSMANVKQLHSLLVCEQCENVRCELSCELISGANLSEKDKLWLVADRSKVQRNALSLADGIGCLAELDGKVEGEGEALVVMRRGGIFLVLFSFSLLSRFGCSTPSPLIHAAVMTFSLFSITERHWTWTLQNMFWSGELW